MAEESNPNGESPEELARRLHRLEQDMMQENRWWRGGLLVAIVFLGFTVLFAALHHPRAHHWERPPYAMAGGWGGPGPGGGYQFMAPPSPWAYWHHRGPCDGSPMGPRADGGRPGAYPGPSFGGPQGPPHG